MEWFKHATGSHEDPDISDAWDAFGDSGPLLFWVILEVFGAEFSHLKNDWLTLSVAYFERKTRRKFKKSEKILEFFQNRERIYFKKDQQTISLTIPKFIKIASNWTVRPKDEKPALPTEAPTEAPTAKEEKKKRIEKNKKEIIQKTLFLDVVLLTEIEHQKLVSKYGPILTTKAIEILNNAIMSKGYKYKSHYHTLIGWPMKEAQGGNGNGKSAGTYRTDIRGNEVRDEQELINAEWRRKKALEEAARNNPGGVSTNDDAPDFQVPIAN